MKMTGEQLQQAAAGRAEFSSPGNTELLREWINRQAAWAESLTPLPDQESGSAAVDPGMTNSGSVQHACGRQ